MASKMDKSKEDIISSASWMGPALPGAEYEAWQRAKAEGRDYFAGRNRDPLCVDQKDYERTCTTYLPRAVRKMYASPRRQNIKASF